ncbi:MAG: hypothetical protein V3T79_01645 [Candidatus Scalindua sediminis]
MVEIRKIINGFKHAFSTDDTELKDNDVALIKKLADYVVRRNMSVPTIIFLESVRPLNFLGNQAMIFFKPILTHFFSTSEYNKLANILENRKVIDILISEIEQRAKKRN